MLRAGNCSRSTNEHNARSGATRVRTLFPTIPTHGRIPCGSVVFRAAFDPQHPYFRTRKDGKGGKLLCSVTSARIFAFDDNPQDWEVQGSDGAGTVVHVVSPRVAERLNEGRKDDANLRVRHQVSRTPNGTYAHTNFVSALRQLQLDPLIDLRGGLKVGNAKEDLKPAQRRLLERLFLGCSLVEVTKLHGGFSGSLVLKTCSFDAEGCVARLRSLPVQRPLIYIPECLCQEARGANGHEAR